MAVEKKKSLRHDEPGWIGPADQASLENRPLEFVRSVCSNPGLLNAAVAAADKKEASSQCTYFRRKFR
jgi:hypothetical protein